MGAGDGVVGNSGCGAGTGVFSVHAGKLIINTNIATVIAINFFMSNFPAIKLKRAPATAISFSGSSALVSSPSSSLTSFQCLLRLFHIR